MTTEDRVDLHVQFEWEYVGKVTVDASTGAFHYPDVGAPGVYRLRSGVRGNEFERDCWYVGRSLRDVEGRIESHLSEDYEPLNRRLKKFRGNLDNPEGWVEIDRASKILINGFPHLRVSPPTTREEDPDEFETVEIVWNLIEAAGLFSTLGTAGRASKR